MVSILHRYVLRELVKSFVMALLALTAIMLLGALFKPLQHGLGLRELVQFLPYMLPYSLSWVVPAAMLTACVMTYGRLAAENELQAMRASGVPLRYACYPAFLAAAALAAAAFPLNDRLIPYCRLAKEDVIRRAFYDQPFRTAMLGTNKIGDHKIYVESMDGDTLHNIIVIEPAEESAERRDRFKTGSETGSVRVIRARQARYTVNEAEQEIRIRLEDAQYTIVNPGRNAKAWLEVKADQQVMVIKAEDPEDRLQRRRAEMTTRELTQQAREQQEGMAQASSSGERQRWARRLAHTETEIHLRRALALSIIALCLVGVPLGIWMRRESKLASFAIAVVVFLLLYAMLVGGEGLALEQKLPPRVALWTPDLLTGALGLGMLLRTFRR